MAANFKTFGPFQVRGGVGSTTKEDLNALFSLLDERHPGLAEAIGVYIFARQHGSGAPKPWYVGKTERGNFRKRTWQHWHGRMFARLSEAAPTGELVVFFLARVNGEGPRFKKPARGTLKSITMLEFLLIGTCLSRNRNLLNASQKRFHTGLRVPGYLNERPGKPSGSAKKLAAMLDIG